MRKEEEGGRRGRRRKEEQGGGGTSRLWLCGRGPAAASPRPSASRPGVPWPRGALVRRLPLRGSAASEGFSCLRGVRPRPGPGDTQLMGCYQAAWDTCSLPQGPPVGLLKGAGGLAPWGLSNNTQTKGGTG